MKFTSWLLIFTLLMTSGCATGRNLSSPHYLPEWENKAFNFPTPSETSGGYWAARTAHNIAKGVGKIIAFPFALVGNLVVNSYYVTTWPFRRVFRGDKRFIVWHPLFNVGNEVRSDYYSKAWNSDLV